MADIHHIVCCCGGGMGSSLMVKLNVQKVLKELGREDVTVEHVSLGELSATSPDLLVAGRDITPTLKDYPRIVELFRILDLDELRPKLKEALETSEEEYWIK